MLIIFAQMIPALCRVGLIHLAQLVFFARWAPTAPNVEVVRLRQPLILQIRDAAKRNNVAVCFGYIEKSGGVLFSSQIFIGSSGEVVNNFRRVSVGWKEYRLTDGHYREGDKFEAFLYGGKKFAVGLCGDLWTEGRPEEMRAVNADIVLWPVWCDYGADDWNGTRKYEAFVCCCYTSKTKTLYNMCKKI